MIPEADEMRAGLQPAYGSNKRKDAMPKCTSSPLNAEFTLCGRAFDDDESDDGRPVFAKVGERVTCKECLAVINYCKAFVNNIERKSE
jgi:biotin carboxyl carrier protein